MYLHFKNNPFLLSFPSIYPREQLKSLPAPESTLLTDCHSQNKQESFHSNFAAQYREKARNNNNPWLIKVIKLPTRDVLGIVFAITLLTIQHRFYNWTVRTESRTTFIDTDTT